MKKSDDSEKEQLMTSKALSAHNGNLEDKESSNRKKFCPRTACKWYI